MNENPVTPPIRIFLALRNRFLRDTLSRIFRKRSGFLVCGSAAGEEWSPQILAEVPCDIVVMDFVDVRGVPLDIPREDGAFNPPKVLLICMANDPEEFLGAVRCGAAGYVSKDASTSDVIAAVRSTFRGEAVCPPKLCAHLFQVFANSAAGRATPPSYTPPVLTLRQQRLVALLAKGLTNREVAAQLHLSEFTVRNHLYRIMKRLGARTRTQVIHAVSSPAFRCFSSDTLRRTIRRRY